MQSCGPGVSITYIRRRVVLAYWNDQHNLIVGRLPILLYVYVRMSMNVCAHHCNIPAYDIDTVNGKTVLRETLEQLPKPNYDLLKYIR